MESTTSDHAKPAMILWCKIEITKEFRTMPKELKLNLGCGQNPKEGYTNVDKYGDPDVKHDLETFPWPFDDSSVSEIELNHVLEHLGQTTEIFLNIMKEMYRVCKDQAVVKITVPHPRHDDYLNDPTHVRPITPMLMSLFSKQKNRESGEKGEANSPLALFLDIDFETIHLEQRLDESISLKLQKKEIPENRIPEMARSFNNIVREFYIELKAIKPDAN